MKRFFLNYLVIAALALSAAFTSCDKKDKGPKTFTVTFDSNGGSAVAEQIITEGENVTEPTPPTKTGYTFAGWYTDNGTFEYKWNFANAVTTNITLYAKWDENPPNTFTVNFESNGGSVVEQKIVNEGDKATRPSDPTKEGFTFAGWYSNATLITEWRFDIDVVISDMVLFAKWALIPTVSQAVVDFIFQTNSFDEKTPSLFNSELVSEREYATTQSIDGVIYTTKWECETRRYSASENPDNFFMFDPLASVLWPGNLVQGNSIASGVPTSIPISKRQPGNISFAIVSPDKEGVVNEYYRTVDNMQLSYVNQAMNEVLAGYGGHGYAKYNVEIGFVETAEDFNIKLKAGYSGGVLKANAAFNTDWGVKKTRMLVKLHQQYYTMVYDDPDGINGVFTPDITVDDVKNYSGNGNPMCYISSVTYGRVYYLLYESTASKQELNAALNFAFYGFSTSSEAEFNKVMSNSYVNVTQIGGNAESGLNSATDLKAIKDFLINGANFSAQNPGAPISYTIKYLKDASLVRMNNTMDYTVESCVPISEHAYNTQSNFNIRINDNNVRVLTSNRSNLCENFLGIDIGYVNNVTGGTILLVRHPENDAYKDYGKLGRQIYNANYMINFDAGKVQVSKENSLYIRFRVRNKVDRFSLNFLGIAYDIAIGSGSYERTVYFDYNPAEEKWVARENPNHFSSITFISHDIVARYRVENTINYSITID